MTYTLSTTGAGIKPYTFEVAGASCEVNQKTITYSTESGSADTIPQSGGFDASVYVSADAPKGTEVMIVLAGYDDKGYPVSIEHKNVTSVDGIAADTVKIEGLTAEKCKTVQCFVWEKTSFGYRIVK